MLAKPQKNAALVSSPMELEAEVGFQPTRTLKPFTGLHRNTVVWKAYADFGWKAPHSPAGKQLNHDFRQSFQNPSTILPLSCHYLEAEVGIAPRLPSPAKNSADFAAQSITIRHHRPVPTWILLKLLLKVSNGGVNYSRLMPVESRNFVRMEITRELPRLS